MGWIQRLQRARQTRQARRGEEQASTAARKNPKGGQREHTVGQAPGALEFSTPEELWTGFGQEAGEPAAAPFSFEEELERQALRYRQDMEELW